MFSGWFFIMARKKSIKIADSLEELFDMPVKNLKTKKSDTEEYIGGFLDSSIRLKQESGGNFSQRMICPPPLDKIRITKQAFTDLINIGHNTFLINKITKEINNVIGQSIKKAIHTKKKLTPSSKSKLFSVNHL